MKQLFKPLSLLIIISAFFLFANNNGYSQQTTDSLTGVNMAKNKTNDSTVNLPGQYIYYNDSKKAGFFTTFLKTPFALISLIATLVGCCFAGFFELIYNIFCGFDCGFDVTKSIWNIGWKNIVINWWWKPGVTWHLIVCIILCSSILGARRR